MIVKVKVTINLYIYKTAMCGQNDTKVERSPSNYTNVLKSGYNNSTITVDEWNDF